MSSSKEPLPLSLQGWMVQAVSKIHEQPCKRKEICISYGPAFTASGRAASVEWPSASSTTTRTSAARSVVTFGAERVLVIQPFGSTGVSAFISSLSKPTPYLYGALPPETYVVSVNSAPEATDPVLSRNGATFMIVSPGCPLAATSEPK